MQTVQSDYAMRRCAHALIQLLEEHRADEQKLRDGILAATRDLLEQPDLPALGAKRQGNFVSNSKYLYYDGQLEITLNQMPKDKRFPAHDHGTCEP
jgi:hypothetical protein